MTRKILIVDDQEDILLILEREFRRVAGYSVISTSKPAEALKLISEKQIDLVISDVRLGADSGFDLVRVIKGAHPHVGSILMSAYRSPSNRVQAEALGVIMFLEKPFQIARMIEAVDGFFAQRDAPVAAPIAAPIPVPVSEPVPVPVSVANAPLTASMSQTSSLSHFKLEDLVQLFCLNGRNILITVGEKENQGPGVIYIQRGRLIHAEFGEKNGDEAFLSLMRISEPRLKVKDWAAPVPVTIASNWEHLLLLAAVQVDQSESQELPDFPLDPGMRMQGG